MSVNGWVDLLSAVIRSQLLISLNNLFKILYFLYHQSHSLLSRDVQVALQLMWNSDSEDIAWGGRVLSAANLAIDGEMDNSIMGVVGCNWYLALPQSQSHALSLTRHVCKTLRHAKKEEPCWLSNNVFF